MSCNESALSALSALAAEVERMKAGCDAVKKKIEKIKGDEMSWRWITVSEASRITGLSRPTIYAKINDGSLARHEVCGRLFVDRGDLYAMFSRS